MIEYSQYYKTADRVLQALDGILDDFGRCRK